MMPPEKRPPMMPPEEGRPPLVTKRLVAYDTLSLEEWPPPSVRWLPSPRVRVRDLLAWWWAWVRYVLRLSRCRCGWNKHRPTSPWEPPVAHRVEDAIAEQMGAEIVREAILQARWRSVAEHGLPPYVEGELWWVWGPTLTAGPFTAYRNEEYGWTDADPWSMCLIAWYEVVHGVTHYQRAEPPPLPRLR
jgi:hypothetical protein